MIEISCHDTLDRIPVSKLLSERIKYTYHDFVSVRVTGNAILELNEGGDCTDCAFNEDEVLGECHCPYSSGCLVFDSGYNFKVVKMEDAVNPSVVSISKVRSAICNSDICIYHVDNLSCQISSPICLFRDIIKKDD